VHTLLSGYVYRAKLGFQRNKINSYERCACLEVILNIS